MGPVWNVLDTSAALYRSITQWALTTPPWVHDFALFATQGLLVVFIALAALHWWFARTITALAVRMTRELSPKTELEASGGLTLEVAGEYASTGVHYLAVGGLTHSAPALDIGLDM